MSKSKGIIKSIVAVVLVGGLAVGGYFLYKNFDTVKNKVTDWWNDITNQEQKPTQNDQVKDFTFSGNKITGYKGSEVVLDNLPTSYSMNIGDVEETIEISIEDMSDEEAMKDFTEKVENSSFYCTPNGGDRFFSATYQEWNDYMSKHYPNEEQMKAFPMKFEFCSVTFTEGTDYQITEIADGAFSYNTILSKVVIPENIQSIGQQAFYNCENLTEINIPEGITEIKYQTFYGCKNLENIMLPDSLTSIGYGAFDLTAIKSLTIPANVSNLDMIVSDKSSLEEIHINSILINPEQITSLASFASNLKIYVPDSYFLENYDMYFNYYLENIYPENGTYPEEPEPEPEGRELKIIFKNGEDIVSNETYNILDNNKPQVKVPEEPTQGEDRLFCGWELNGEIFDDNQIEYMLINNADKYLDTVTFIAHFYDAPKLLEEFDINGEIKEEIETLTIVEKYCCVQKHTNIQSFNTKEELLEAKELYNGKKFAYKNETGSYTYLGKVDFDIYKPNFTYPLTCSSIETYVYDLSNYSEEEIYNFKSRNNYQVKLNEDEYYQGSEASTMEYKEFRYDLAEKNVKTITFTEGTIFYDYALIDCSPLEKIVLENSTIITVVNTDSSQVEESENLQIPEKVKVYVPDNLINAYKTDKTWAKVADQIHPMSELAEG